jgi:hypothetical protein
VNYLAGYQPYSVAIGDLDGDQVPDLAVACGGDQIGIVSVLLGLGDGTFAPAVNYYAGVSPRSVAIGDLDGDQAPDLVTPTRYRDNVSVLLGVGDGTFAAAVNSPAGDGPRSAAIGDLDGDQVPDLAVANHNSENVSVLLGAGDGTFAAAVHYPISHRPSSVAIGDLDGDQVPDLAVANMTWPKSNNVSVLLGVGDGTFAAAVHYAVGDYPESVAIGDLDGDQVPDLAVSNMVSWNISVLLGLGDGTFAPAVHYPAYNNPRSVAIGDLDGDQVPDLAVANDGALPYVPSAVSVLLGLGDGTFAPEVIHFTGDDGCYSVAIGDLDGDHVPDLAVANGSYYGNVSVMRGLGGGAFAPAVHYPAGERPGSVVIGDLDGDQVPDLAAEASGDSGDVLVLLGLGDGTFAAAMHYGAGRSPSSVAIGDLDGDLAPDLAVANHNTDDVSVLLHQIPGLFDCNGNVIRDPCDLNCGRPGGPCDLPGCGQSTDCNGNGVPDECDRQYTDIGLFVGQLLAESPDPVLVCMFDQNGDATLDGTDIRGFAVRLVSGG